jgi:hypothetical protein
MAKKTIKKLRITGQASNIPQSLKNTQDIFQYAINSVSSFYAIYQKGRRGSTGSTTHEEQDLLRAMLVFACSGLDAVVKQLIKDTLPKVIDNDKTEKDAQEAFRKFIERRIKKNNSFGVEEKSIQIDTSFISKILSSQSPRNELLKALQESLNSNSLQSRDELLKVAGYFAITQEEVLQDTDTTKLAFETRNDIIHEMDVDLKANKQGQKKRKVRGAPNMIKYTENILNIGACFINTVAKKV